MPPEFKPGIESTVPLAQLSISEPKLFSGNTPQALRLLESTPLSSTAWEEMAQRVRGQNDPLSIKSIEIIIDGLKKIEEFNLQSVAQKQVPLVISSASELMFARLARAYNSPTLLKEVGLIYLRELNLPYVALRHFERSLRLGGPEKELRPLCESASVAVQRQLTRRTGVAAAHSGVAMAQHTQPVAIDVIRKTGKILMPSRIAQTVPLKTSHENAGAVPPEPFPATTEECLDQAEACIRSERYDRARSLLRHANERPAEKAQMWQAWTNLGQAFFEAGQPVEVEAAFVEALKYDPDELASQFNAALGYQLNQKYDLALETYLKANRIDPKHPKVWCNLGVLYFQMDRFTQAESALRFATMASPEYARAWDNLAAALGAQGKLDESLLACRRAIEIRGEYPEAFFKMGVIYFSQNDLHHAADEFRRAARLHTLSAYCDSFQAMIHARMEQTEAGEEAVLRAVKADPKCDLIWMAWNDVGLAWYTEGNFSRAATAYGEATIIKPDEPDAWFNLGVSFHKLGDLDAARDAYQQAVDLRESLVGAWHNLGLVCAQKGDDQAAMRAFQQEVHWAPGNVRAWYDLGVTLEKLGRAEDAKMAYQKVDRLNEAADPSAIDSGNEIPYSQQPKSGPIPLPQRPLAGG